MPSPSPATAVVLCNLGTPDAPTAPAVRRYLAQFLSDPRVVEIPRAVWLPILYGAVLTTRPAKSAAKYASIWLPEGSPLKVWTERQAAALQEALGPEVTVRAAMRYGEPALASVLDALRAQGADRILVLPAYPQYSGTTTASVWDALAQWAGAQRNLPALRFVRGYHDDAGYIGALAATVRAHWQRNGRGGHLVMSFHGVPQRTVDQGDSYADECRETARLLAAALQLQEGSWSLSFQSRFGKAKWLEPATEPSLVALACAGTARVDVMCPGFTSDCLETLEEIDQEGRAAFMAAGGSTFHYIPCLNADAAWTAALAGLARRQLAGWLPQSQENQAAAPGSWT
ncbi:ferrochelatase [uncultured Ramlibacter sp.]|uniref:ferrochelatase n=1 Tax=uncultured Ramlibacter sp. TaxID=260755 RepID=UPI002621496F|nr:ferrochelatase [uncultured Ramlibacter sp.]